MKNQTTFFRISSVVVLFALLAIVVSGVGSAQARPNAQATATVGAMATDASAMGTMGAAATMSSDGAIPPCPQNMMMSTMSATMAGTSAMAATMAATMAMPASAATMDSSSNATMAATMAVMPGMSMNGCELTAKLIGSNEVPKAGAPDGKGTALLMISRPATGPGEICFNIQVSGLTLPATAAHIHVGAAGVAGPVVVPFMGPDASGNASGCTENVDRDLITKILTNPANYYVNVHNADFPGGAMRGQLAVATQ